MRDGSAYPRASYAILFAILAPLRTCSIAQDAGGAIVSGLSRTADLWVGMPFENDTVPAGTTVKSIDSTSQVTLSANASASTANALGRFFLHGYGNGGGATTFGVMDDRGLFERALDQGARGYEKTTVTATHTAGSNILTGMNSTRGMYIGQAVWSASLNGAGATVAAILSASSVRVSISAPSGGTMDLILTGGQIGNERGDTLQGHLHQNTTNSGKGYTPGGTVNDYLNPALAVATTPASGVGPAITDGVNGVPRLGSETRGRFRNYLPIIVY